MIRRLFICHGWQLFMNYDIYYFPMMMPLMKLSDRAKDRKT